MVVASRIAEVRVYRQGATVVRVVDLEVGKEGVPTEIEVAGLPLALQDGTVRIRVDGVEGSGTLTATDHRVGLTVREREEVVKDPEVEALRDIDRQIVRHARALALREAEIALLSDLQMPERPSPKKGEIPPRSPIAARIALEDFVHDAVSARWADCRAEEEALRALRERRAALQDQLSRASSARLAKADELSKTVIATLVHEGGPATRARITVEYYVPGARWAPQYQVKLTRDGAEAEIQLRAVVCQRTGEDWRGVRLLLSTADPLQFTELPRLSSIRIGKAQPPARRQPGFRAPPRGAERLFTDHDRDLQAVRGLLPAPPEFSFPDLDLEPPEPVAATSLRDAVRSPAGRGAKMGGFDSVFGSGAAGGGAEGLAYSADELDLEEEEMVDTFGDEPEPAMEMDLEAKLEAPPEPKPPPAPRAGPDSRTMAAPSAQPARRKAKKMAMREKELMKPQPGGGGEDVAPTFAMLRLGSAADAARRGRLHPVDQRAAYLEILSRTSVEVRIDVMQVVQAAVRRAAEAASVPTPPGTVEVSRSSGLFDYVYPADIDVDVPADGSWHSIALGTRVAPCALTYVVVPREETDVYRLARIDNPTNAPLLQGPAEVYVDGEYVLTTTVPTVSPRARFQLGLGVEQAIKCARNARFEEQRSGSKVVAMTELVHDIEITLANNLKRQAPCEVRERIPQPAEDAEVVVEQGDVSPPWEAYDQEDRGRLIEGGHRWQVTVPPGGRQTLTARYVIKLYAQNEVVGGNRREA